MKKYLKYLIIGIFALVISKWIIVFLPSNSSDFRVVKEVSYKQDNKTIKEVQLSLDLSALKPQIEKEYQLAKEDVHNYIVQQMNEQKKESKYRLTKEDGFLDWLFGYWTGWEMMWKKLKGFFGSSDNEVKLVSDNFESMVINPGLSNRLKNINSYTKNRIDDYYKNVITITIHYINQNIAKLKQQGYTNIHIYKNTIPWSQYVVARGGEVLVITKGTGLGMGIMVGKYVGSKVAAIIGPKLLGIVEAKTASIVAGKIVSIFEFVLAPIIDYAANEAVKAAKYDETKRSFSKIIDDIFYDMTNQIDNKANNSLIKVKNKIYEELNKQVVITTKEIE